MEERNIMPLLTQSFTMSGGDGSHSYAHNSSYQREGILNAKKKTAEAILATLDLRNPHFDLNVLRVADFGCSVGPNAFDVIQHIIDTVKLKFQQENNMKNLEEEDLDFHVFFNDQTQNDFNTLFRKLPSKRKYFVAGVPGSFYGRVFPRNSLHIGHTSYTLIWLSKAPENARKLDSKAHKERFLKDMEIFLEARAEELVPGGLMIILVPCLLDGVPHAETVRGVLDDIFLSCFIDMANSGIISEEKAKMLKFPMYFPRTSELKGAIEQNGSFSIEMMHETKRNIEDSSLSHENIISFYRGLFHGFMEEHFGGCFVDEFFDRLAKELTKYNIDDFKKAKDNMECVIVLKRNVL